MLSGKKEEQPGKVSGRDSGKGKFRGLFTTGKSVTPIVEEIQEQLAHSRQTSSGDNLPKTEVTFEKEEPFFGLQLNDLIEENEMSKSESSDEEEASSINLTHNLIEIEAYRDHQDMLEQNLEDAAEYAFILIDKIKSYQMTQIQLLLMDNMINIAQAQNYMDELLDSCIQKVKNEKQESDFDGEIPNETLKSNFVSDSYHSKNKNNLLSQANEKFNQNITAHIQIETKIISDKK